MNANRKSALTILSAIAFACGAPSSLDEDLGGDTPSAAPVEQLADAAASSGFVAVAATASDAGFPATNAVDGTLTTRWTALGKGQYIVGDLGAFKTLTGLRISWYRGAARRSTFEIRARGTDNVVRTVWSGQSSGTTDGLELYSFPAVNTRNVWVVVNGNTENDYANLWEMQAVTQGTTTPPPPPPAAVAITASPSTAAVQAGGAVQLSAAVTGSTNTSVTWTVQEGAAGGAVSSTGLYTAPSAAGTFHVVARSVADASKTAVVTITVTVPVGVTVSRPTGGDDTASFNAAIVSANGSVVNVPAGTYLVRAVAVSRANTSIVCSATTPAVIKLRALAAGDGSPIFNVTANNFTIRNCILDGNKAAQPAGGFNDSFMGRSFRTAVKIDGAYSGLTVDRTTFQNVYGAGIATRRVSAIKVTNSVFKDNFFEAVFATTPWTGGDPVNHVTGFVFTGNTVTNARSRHSSINANGLLAQQTWDLDISNNVWDGFERNAMKLENCRNGTVANNRIRNGDLSWAGIGMQNGSHSMTITGNTLENVGSGIDTSLVVGGQYGSDKIENLVIRGNTINGVHSGAMPDGIRILGYAAAMTDVTIENNVIRSVPRHGINVRQFTNYYASPTFTRITIRNNQLTSAGACNNWFSGTSVMPTSSVTSPNTCG